MQEGEALSPCAVWSFNFFISSSHQPMILMSFPPSSGSRCPPQALRLLTLCVDSSTSSSHSVCFPHLFSALKFSGVLAGCELYLILCQFSVPYHVCETLSSGNSCSIALGVFLVYFWTFCHICFLFPFVFILEL